MTVLYEFRTRLWGAMPVIIGALLVGYFSYHVVQGHHGVVSYLKLRTQVTEAKVISEKLNGERVALENRVALLQPDHIDPDMLEERARQLLHMTHPDDVVVLGFE